MKSYKSSQLSKKQQVKQQPQQQLNQSRFLVEEVNFDEQPTQQQILERAQQLQIDDLLLAKQSLTRQIDPQWKPYCNRLGDIYYINFLQKLAYIDHPIDMYFKKQYATMNGIAPPKFKSFKLEQVVKSLDLVEQQIRAFKMQNHKAVLNIVYQQQNQQEASSYHPNSPMNHEQLYFREEQINQKENQGLNGEQLEYLYEYQRQIQRKYEQQLEKIKQKNKNKLKIKEQQHQIYISKIREKKLQQFCQQYEEQVTKKNKIDLNKQSEKIDAQYQDKIMEFCQNIHKFNRVFEQLREKQREIQNIFQHKNAIERMKIAEHFNHNAQLQRNKAIEKTRQKLRKQFNQNMLSVLGNSKQYQDGLKNSLSKLYRQIKYQNLSSKLYKNYHNRHNLQNYTQRQSIKIDQIMQNQDVLHKYSSISTLSSDISYQQLKKQIKGLNIWEEQQIFIKNKTLSLNNPTQTRIYQPSLNLRLRMRII